MSSIRRYLNRSIDMGFFPIFHRFWLDRLRGKVNCLVYHRVIDDYGEDFSIWGGVPAIQSTELQQDLEIITSKGGTFLTFSDLRNGKALSQNVPYYILCFDDGFADVYRVGLPVLEEYSARAVIFQTAEMVEADDLIWEHQLYWYMEDPEKRRVLRETCQDILATSKAVESNSGRRLLEYLRDQTDYEEVRCILESVREKVGDASARRKQARRLYPRGTDLMRAEAGGHEIGSHGWRHIRRSLLSREDFETELRNSSQILAQYCGSAPDVYAFPFGDSTQDDIAVTDRYYSQSVNAHPGAIDPAGHRHRMPRNLWPGSARNALRRHRWLLSGRI